MIITVKTLDSQNHQFTVDDNFTVEQFKTHIQDQVNIPASRQRIIYCGRVLQDNVKLSNYDVDGKVVHLVQRAPPSATSRNVRSVTPPPDLGRARGGFRGFDRVGNTVYMGMGSMAFPQGLVDPQQRIPRATHTLSSSRLNVARRMLRSAEIIIRQLENPSGNNEQPPPDEPVEEEMTPVIEARVIVPSHGGQPIDENAIVNAVENTIFASGVANLDAGLGPSTSSTTHNTENSSGLHSSSSTPEASTPRSSSTENLNAETNGEATGEGLRPSRTRCRGTEMAELLTTLNQLQVRFAPFLARYQSFMQEDPQVSQENLQETRQMLTRVSQVLHYLGHAYHSLSDIMINVDQAPPRLLLCRPILIQHSAVVQAGIPIQVEAQINLSTDRPGPTPSNASSGSSSGVSSTGATINTGSTDSSVGSNVTPNPIPNGQAQPQPGGPSITLQPGFVDPPTTRSYSPNLTMSGINYFRGSSSQNPPEPSDPSGLPFMPGGSMRVITTPVEIHTVRPNAARPQSANNNNNTTTAPTSAPASQNIPSAPQAPPSGEAGQQGTGPVPAPGGPFGANNGNLEFFMEVTPEGITIDSLETALVGSNQAANELLRGNNLLHSLMQLVGSHMGGNFGPIQLPQERPTPTTGESMPQNHQANAQAQNYSQSQARSTQTNPTTSTHTRSTPRPHVHMTQQAVQGGFDPFLPCYSHHVTHSRGQRIVSMGQPQQTNRQEPTVTREATSTTGQTSNATSAQANQQTPPRPGVTPPPNLANLTAQFEDLVRGLLPGDIFENSQTAPMLAEAVSMAMRAARHPPGPPGQQQAPQRGAPDGQGAPPPNPHHARSQQDILGFISGLMGQSLPDLLGNGPTLDQYVQSLHPEPYVQGESLIIDLIMLMLRNLRLNDLIMISSGNMTPLHRQMDTIQGFFLTEVCQNDTTDAGIHRATERIMNDFRPLINALESIPPRDDIDMVRTVDAFFRQRVPGIIRLAISGERNGTNLLTVIWRAAKELLALALHCSANGQQGVETVCEEVMFSTIFNQSNIPTDIHNWTIANSRTALRTIIQNLNITPAEVQQYVVRTTHPTASVPSRVPVPEPVDSRQECQTRDEANAEVESMEVEYAASPTNAEPVLETPPIRVEDTEPLPNVIWGSESWHRQTPQDWVPIITRDVQKQRRQNSQAPFSDAYLSGMPSKRRKLINNSKPQGSLSHVISESVRQAVTATGLTSAAPLEVVTQAAGQSTEIQGAYRTLLRSTVQANLRDNEDFSPERFPNTANYFNGSPPE